MNEFMPTKAKEMPTANASILVATASVNTTFKRVGSKQHLSSLLSPSFLSFVLPKSQKAESYPVVIVFYQMAEPAGTEPSNKGHNGLKESEKECHYKKVRRQMRRMMIPLVMDTVKQSIARLIAKSQISSVFIH